MSDATIALYPHGGSKNHGCEAIVRSTKVLLKKNLILFSDQPEEDKAYSLDSICQIKHSQKHIKKYSFPHISSWFSYHLRNNHDAFDQIVFSDFLKDASRCGVAFSIGGDNYCYGGPERLYFLDRELRKRKVKTVLWGCSVEPSNVDKIMLDDLKGFTHIIARESITYDYLKSAGVTQVSLFPDPAFILETKEIPLPDGVVDRNVVGINISPMIIRKENNQGMVLRNYINLINYVLSETDMSILLIPHVVRVGEDDRVPLEMLYEKCKETGRVFMINDYSAEILKGIIARCRFMVAARTHASIAAYSTMVPTFVLGYSVKARGIAKDLFGSIGNYVFPVQDLDDEYTLSRKFEWMLCNESDILRQYDVALPPYLGRLNSIKDTVEEICST